MPVPVPARGELHGEGFAPRHHRSAFAIEPHLAAADRTFEHRSGLPGFTPHDDESWFCARHYARAHPASKAACMSAPRPAPRRGHSAADITDGALSVAVIGDYVAAFSTHRQGVGIRVFGLCRGEILSRSAHAGEALAEYLTETEDSHLLLAPRVLCSAHPGYRFPRGNQGDSRATRNGAGPCLSHDDLVRRPRDSRKRHCRPSPKFPPACSIVRAFVIFAVKKTRVALPHASGEIGSNARVRLSPAVTYADMSHRSRPLQHRQKKVRRNARWFVNGSPCATLFITILHPAHGP